MYRKQLIEESNHKHQVSLFNGKIPINVPDILFVTAILEFITILIISFTSEDSLKIFGVYALLILTVFVCGALIGTIFGVPKINQKKGANQSNSPNRSLEQISDWIAAIVVGLSLANFTTIGEQVDDAAQLIIGRAPYHLNYVVVIFLMIFNFSYGFLFGWLSARINLGRILNEADKYLNEAWDKVNNKLRKEVVPNEISSINEASKSTNVKKSKVNQWVENINLLEEEGVLIDHTLYRNIGVLLYKIKNYATAKEYFQKSYGLSNDVKSLINLGAVYGQGFGDDYTAIRMYEIALKLQPAGSSYYHAYYNLACSYSRLNKFKNSLENLKKAVQGGEKYLNAAQKDSIFSALEDNKKNEFSEIVPNYIGNKDQKLKK